MNFKELFYNLFLEIIIFLYGKSFDRFTFNCDIKKNIDDWYYFEFIFRINGLEQKIYSEKFPQKNKEEYIKSINEYLIQFYNKIQYISNPNKLYLFHNCYFCNRIFKSSSKKIGLVCCPECCEIKKNPHIQPEMYLYIFQSIITGLIKIGISKDYEKRKKQLEKSHGSRLNILLIIKGNQTIEKELHSLFKQFKTEGEWYYPDNEIYFYIKKKRIENNDILFKEESIK